MNSRMLSRAIVATALVGAIAVPSAMACGGGKGHSGPPGGTAYTQPATGPSHNWDATRGHRGDRHRDRDRQRGDRGRGDCNPAPPPVTPPVDPPPVDPPPTGPEL